MGLDVEGGGMKNRCEREGGGNQICRGGGRRDKKQM